VNIYELEKRTARATKKIDQALDLIVDAAGILGANLKDLEGRAKEIHWTTCAVCDDQFIKTRPDRIYCSSQCSRRVANSKRPERMKG